MFASCFHYGRTHTHIFIGKAGLNQGSLGSSTQVSNGHENPPCYLVGFRWPYCWVGSRSLLFPSPVAPRRAVRKGGHTWMTRPKSKWRTTSASQRLKWVVCRRYHSKEDELSCVIKLFSTCSMGRTIQALPFLLCSRLFRAV